MTSSTSLHHWGNALEAGLWILVGLVFMVQAYRLRADLPKRNRCLLAAAAFVVFGLSDIIEIHTGAWWRPWWLLAMKAACIGVFLVLLIAHYLQIRKTAHRD